MILPCLATDEKICIIIPVYNRKEITLRCLANLAEVEAFKQYSIIVVDDNSIDGTKEAIEASFPSVYLLDGSGSLWWTGAIALAMQHAYNQNADYLVWLNDDCLLEAGTISDLVSLCRSRHRSITGVQGYCSESHDRVAFGGKEKTWRGYRWLSIPEGEVAQCDLLSGNLVCLPRTVIDEIGYPDIYNTPHYGGDSLYLIRAQKAGFRLWVDARHLVYDSVDQDSPLYPQQWLLVEGSPWMLLSLVFTPQSGLSWRVWFWINWESQGFWGLIMLLKKYLSILLITAIRTLPLPLRVSFHSKIDALRT